MNAKHLLMAPKLFVLVALAGGCHYGSYDGHRGYSDGYSNSSELYRDGFRDGRTYERRRDDWNDRYSNGYWRRR